MSASIDRRLEALEAAQTIDANQSRLVLLAPDGRLSEADQARADAARATGRGVLQIDLIGVAPNGKS